MLDYKFDGLATGNYRVTLYFAELYFTTAGSRIFSVAVQGTTLITNLDLVADAGALTADVKNVVAHVDNGQLDIHLSASTNNAQVNAIEIQSTTDPVTLPPVPSVTSSIVNDAYVAKGTQVSLAAIPQATIFYTADGTDPRSAPNRSQYTGPITINNDVVIKAYATAPNMADSGVSTFTYMIRPASPAPNAGPAGRQELNLSGTGWRAWMDTSASWQADRLYLPEQVYLPKMPVNPPTGGWNVLNDTNGKKTSLPATVEQTFANGDQTWTYHGVTWFWNNHVAIPGNWAGKTVTVGLDRARVRAEIYVNGTLAGYNAVPDTPYKADVSPYLHYGTENTIAIRITNPGGSRGWYDGLTAWGQYSIPSRDDYGDIGNVNLVATNNVYVDDLFVENRPPATGKTVAIHTTVKNKMASDMPLTMSIAIASPTGGPGIYRNSWQVTARALNKSDLTESVTVPQASLWSPETPNLYDATVTVTGGGVDDAVTQRFGFRDFEVSKANYYLNGKRFVLKSAIEMGYYAGTGDIATPDLAAKSVSAAKAIGHNAIQMHRHIGDPLILQSAAEDGLFIYEEPGDFHGLDNDGSFASRLMLDKIQRMTMRDRSDPSLIIVNLSNEDNTWNGLREQAMNLVHNIDPTIMVTNTSGAGGDEAVNNIMPYSTQINDNYFDDHNVASSESFSENSFTMYNGYDPNVDESKDAYFLGEDAAYTGPENWYLLGQSAATGTDNQYYQAMHDKILAYFNENRLNSAGNGDLKSPADVTQEAGLGKAYSNGRVEQSLLMDSSLDGFAMNAWSEGPLTYESSSGWTSGLTDAGKNLKAPPGDYSYWNRDLQVVIQRTNGKYFTPGQPAQFRVGLINEERLPAGDYTLTLQTYDGNGNPTANATSSTVTVAGGDTFAQTFMGSFTVVPAPGWAGGYLTVEGKLYKGASEVANGKEQVLLQNRPSFGDKMSALRGAVYGWGAAKTAITDTGATVDDYPAAQGKLDYLAAGGPLPDGTTLDSMLARVHNDGTRMLVKLDQNWADALYSRGILSQKVTSWGGTQANSSWWSNGWGYLDYFVGNQSVPSGSTISTNGWEAPEQPNAFYPFTSKYPQSAYGAYLAWPDTLQVQIGTIKYGNGTIILDATYPVDDNNALSDMLFYNLLTMNIK